MNSNLERRISVLAGDESGPIGTFTRPYWTVVVGLMFVRWYLLEAVSVFTMPAFIYKT